METPGISVERKPVTIDTFLDVEKTHIIILYSDPKDYEVDANKLHLGGKNTGAQITQSRNPETIRTCAISNYETQMMQGIFSNNKDCVANQCITGWSKMGRDKYFCKKAVTHIMMVIKRKVGDITSLKPSVIIALFNKHLVALELEDLKSIGLSPSRLSKVTPSSNSSASTDANNMISNSEHDRGRGRGRDSDRRSRSRDRNRLQQRPDMITIS